MARIERVTVLGSGIMGHGIAQISAMAGYKVIMRDVDQQFLDRAMERIRWSLNKLVEKGRISNSEMTSILDRISVTVDLEEAVRQSDLIIEAIPEDMRLKKEIFTKIDAIAPTDAVLASNTSTLPITEMASVTKREDKFIGIHFFNPPQLMQLVEVIPGAKTSRSTIDLAIGYVKSLKKEPILCRKDVAGFIVNRIFIPLVHEAAWDLHDGKAGMREIDAAFKFKLSFPMGIFELADYTGIDVVYKATKEMYARDRRVVNPCPIIEDLYSKGYYGQKSGRGFYEYKQGAYTRIELSMQEAERYDPVRLLAVAINNASWLISNDVVSKDDVERALMLGMGIREGIFKVAERVGYARLVDTLRVLKVSSRNDFYDPDRFLLSLVL